MGFTTYDQGIPQPTKEETPEVDTGEMRLAYTSWEREDVCPIPLRIDYKDFFYLSNKEGWKSMIFPNDSEKHFYDVKTSKMMGVVMFCLTACDWNKCSKGDLRDTFHLGALKMKINGVPVVSFTKIDRCWAAKGEENGHRWSVGSEGKFEVRARIDADEYSYLRYSSFIVL